MQSKPSCVMNHRVHVYNPVYNNMIDHKAVTEIISLLECMRTFIEFYHAHFVHISCIGCGLSVVSLA